MVFPALSRGPEPHVLLVRVRQQEQLQPPDQRGLLRQPRPPALLQVRREVHRHGLVPRQVHLLRLYHALLQTDAEQEVDHEGHRVHRPRVLQLPRLDQGQQHRGVRPGVVLQRHLRALGGGQGVRVEARG